MHALAFALGAVLLMSSTQTPYEEDANPLTRNSGVYTDRLGSVVFSDENDPEEAIFGEEDEYIGVGFGPSAQTFDLSGLYNADFQLGPPDPAQPISDSNALPYWRLVNVSGGGLDAYWVEDSAAPSGHAIRFEANGVAAELYLEQIIPYMPRNGYLLGSTKWGAASGAADVETEVKYQFIKSDGTTTGSERIAVSDPWAVSGETMHRIIGRPTDARYVRVQIDVEIYGATTGETRNLQEVYLKNPGFMWVTLTGTDVSMPATGSRLIELVSTNSNGTPAAESWGSPTVGFIAAIGARSSAAVAGAAIDFRVADFGIAQAATATMAIGETEATALVDEVTDDDEITSASILTLHMSVPSGTLSSTTNDVFAWALVGLAPAP
jgi:hypothetical protein